MMIKYKMKLINHNGETIILIRLHHPHQHPLLVLSVLYTDNLGLLLLSAGSS